MLTKRQEGLFKLLELDTALERQVRDAHKQMVQGGYAPKDFTRHLTKWLHRRWARERRLAMPYLGD